MNRRSLLVFIIVILVFLVSACDGKNKVDLANIQTQEVVQASEPTLTQPSVSESTNQAVEPAMPEATSTPANEPTAEATAEQPAPTQASASTSDASSGGTSSASPSQPEASAETPACINKAAFYEDVTIPDDTVIRQGNKFTKTWRVRNEGDCTWKGYQLTYAGGEAMNAAPTNPIADTAPGDLIDISVDMKAPGRGGTYLSYWQFSTTNGQTFGVGSGANGLLWARIQVDYASGEDVTLGSTNPTTSSSTSTTTTGSTSGGNTGSSSSGSTTTPVSTSGSNTGSSSSGNTTAGCNYSLNAGYESQILELINKARTDNGLSTLTRDSLLDAAALEHSLDMACNDFISHTGSDGSLWYQRVSKKGFANSNSARENIYTGSPDFGGDANGAFTWWMNSQIHRDNILFNKASAVGISYVYSANATYGGLYTLILARP